MNRQELIEKCVVENIKFPGFGNNEQYTVHDLYNDVSTTTLRDMGQRLEKQFEGKTSSRFSTATKTKAQARIEIQLDTIEAVLSHRHEMIAAKRNSTILIQELQAEKELLIRIKGEKKIEELSAKDSKALDKKLAEIESKLAEQVTV